MPVKIEYLLSSTICIINCFFVISIRYRLIKFVFFVEKAAYNCKNQNKKGRAYRI